jgi:hypothetical protein
MKLLTYVCVIFLSFVSLVLAQNRVAPREVRSKLFKQVLAQFPELRECVEKEEGGTRAAEERASAEEVDLNRDRVPEYEFQLSSPCDCGMVNCSIYLYRQSVTGYELILDGASGLGLEVLKTSSNGYADVRVEARDTAATRATTTYKFDGKQYRESRSTVTDMSTGETRPLTRRVQFKRGTSSTTLQGTVTRALSETYLVGARAGQVMTVKLTASNRSVTFLVSSPTTTSLIADNTRDWTGTLPETGDYTIIVQADTRAPYSITISIK